MVGGLGRTPPACPNYHQINLFITSIYMYIIAREREITLTKLSTVAAEGGEGGGGGGLGGFSPSNRDEGGAEPPQSQIDPDKYRNSCSPLVAL